MYGRFRVLAATFLTVALTANAASLWAQDAKPLEVIVFPGGFNWPIFVAEEKGLFAEEGISVNVTPTPNSVFQMTGLIDGQFDIAMTAMDNVVAYVEGQGADPTKVGDLVAFMGSDNGFLRLVAVPGVETVDELRGKKVGVDALTTGYAFALREMLERGGLEPSEIEFVQAGGVMKRFEALMNKEFDATLLVSPFEAAAEQEGFKLLANASEALGAYQGVVGAARREFAQENEEQLVAYVKAYAAALDWLYDPTNKQEAIKILQESVENISAPVAEVSYRVLLDPELGFYKEPRIDAEGVAQVLHLRSKYAEPEKQLQEPTAYYDTRYQDGALQNR